jgi:hypothetical protein
MIAYQIFINFFLKNSEFKKKFFNANKKYFRSFSKKGWIRVDKICFAINSVMLFPHYKTIMSEMNAEEFDILCGNSMSQNDINLVTELCGKNGYTVYNAQDVVGCKIKYKTLVTHHCASLGYFRNSIDKDSSISADIDMVNFVAETKIRLIYGLGKNAWMFSKDNCSFDFYLVYGDFSRIMTERFVKKKDVIFKVGYPRYDEVFFDNVVDFRDKIGVKKDDILIAWLPTHGHKISSIKDFVKVISSLNNDKIKLVAKCHSMESKENIALLKSSNINLIEDSSFNNALLVNAADFVFCDYGGSMFGAIYLDKNLLLLNSSSPEYEIDNDNSFKIFKKDGECKTSLDVEMRKNVVSVNNDITKEELLAILENKDIWIEQKNKLVDIKKYIFEPYYYGFSGKVAKECIYGIHFNEVCKINNKIGKLIKHNEDAK